MSKEVQVGFNKMVITISSFSVWKSKHGVGYKLMNVEVPKRKNFRYVHMDEKIKQILWKEIIDEYEKTFIPVVTY